MRNHGQSFHSDEHDYAVMANDVKQLLESLNIEKAIVIGHSMGGKVAMKLADIDASRLEKLVVLDMSPVKYTKRKHDAVIAGLDSVLENKPTSRGEVMELLAQHIEEDGVRQFLGKSLTKQDDHMTWRFNVPSIKQNYWNIIGWEHVIANTGHWLHAEKPAEVLRAIRKFID